MIPLFKSFIFLLFFNLLLGELSAQSAVVPIGGDISGEGGNVSFTSGLIAYDSIGNEFVTISQGVQQPYEILTVGNNINMEIKLSYLVFPNPVSEDLTLDIPDKEIAGMSYRIFDMNGNILMESLIKNRLSIINMSKLPVASYLLEVIQNQEVKKVFKIIKR
jgi:hypothetical protein